MKKHFVIAGTGRAGTSWLVEFLKEAGLDVGNFEEGAYYEEARAGWERSLLAENNPYVVKDPWLSTYIQVIDPEIIDVLVLPMRNLSIAAHSRVKNEKESIRKYAGQRWDDVEIFGHTPGGIIYSLSVEDQERILAQEFYKLFHWAIVHGIKVIPLLYPRILKDFDYLYVQLADFLPYYGTAKAAHIKTVGIKP